VRNDIWRCAHGTNLTTDKAHADCGDYVSGRTTRLPAGSARLIREVQTVCPGAATYSRNLALQIHNTGINLVCGAHQRTKKIADSDQEVVDLLNNHQVTGRPYLRMINKKVRELAPEDENTFHCGCEVDTVLMEFIMWKTWKVTSVTTGRSEGWKDGRMDARTREFVVAAFLRETRLTVDAFYTGIWGGSGPGSLYVKNHQQFRRDMLAAQIGRMSAELAEMDKVCNPEEVY